MSKSNRSNRPNSSVPSNDTAAPPELPTAVAELQPSIETQNEFAAQYAQPTALHISDKSTVSEIQLTPAVAALNPPVATERKRRAAKPGRPYYAAQQLYLAGGLTAAINDELVKKVDEACGKPNRTESLAWLKIAHQICRGWVDIQVKIAGE